MCPNQGYVHDILISRSSSEGTDEFVDHPRTQGEAALCGITRATSANEDGDGPSDRGPSGTVIQLDLVHDDPWKLVGLNPADREECDSYTAQQISASYRTKSRSVHPDKGGDAQQFAKVKNAHAFLLQNRNQLGPRGHPLREDIELFRNRFYEPRDVIARRAAAAQEQQQNAEMREREVGRMVRLEGDLDEARVLPWSCPRPSGIVQGAPGGYAHRGQSTGAT